MNNENVVFVVIAAVIGVILFFAILYQYYRWIFSIEKQLQNQKQQIEILTLVAEKLGVPPADLEKTIPKEEKIIPIFPLKKKNKAV